MSTATPNASPSLQAAFALLRQGHLPESAEAFHSLLRSTPASAEALHGLSRALMGLGQTREGIAMARAATAAAPGNPALHYALGIMLDETRNRAEAVRAYTTAVRLKPDFVQAWNNLGGILFDLGRHGEAIECLTRATRIEPGAPAYHATLGRMLLAAGQPEAAADRLGTALTLEERAVGGRSTNYPLYARLGEALDRACAARLASPCADVAGTVDLLRRRVQFATFANDAGRAMAISDQIVGLDPGNWPARFARKRILPAVAASAEAMAEARQRYSDGLDDLLAEAGDPAIPHERERILAVTRSDSFFHLAYQGGDDRALQEKLSAVWVRLLAGIVPDCQAPMPKRHNGDGSKRLRVGFAGSHFRQSTIGRYFASWVTGLDSKRFDVHVYPLEQPVEDALTAEIRAATGHCEVLAGPLDEVARRLRAEDLDVLIYPELGMDMPTYVLASLRLAPVQCAAWGHPVTSGHASIDYYFSSEWMEPPGSQSHYTETLVPLPGLGTCYAPEPAASGLARNDFGLPVEGPLFFYPHSLFKIHPDCDDLAARVLAVTPGSHLVAMSRENPWLTDAFTARLRQALARHGVDAGRLVLLRGVAHERFLALAGLCDAMLDTLHWSGGNTTLDVFTVGLPVVTLPGPFVRGRQSAGMLHAIGLDELIAVNPADYVNIARRLALEPAWRHDCTRRILAGHSVLFHDRQPILALEEFLLSVGQRGKKA